MQCWDAQQEQPVTWRETRSTLCSKSFCFWCNACSQSAWWGRRLSRSCWWDWMGHMRFAQLSTAGRSVLCSEWQFCGMPTSS